MTTRAALGLTPQPSPEPVAERPASPYRRWQIAFFEVAQVAKDQLVEFFADKGDTGLEYYYAVLGQHGAEHRTEVRYEARQAVIAAWCEFLPDDRQAIIQAKVQEVKGQ